MATQKSGIYQIKCRPSGKLYVGSSVKIYARWTAHKYHLRRGTHVSPHLQNAWSWHGEDAFHFSILEECDPTILVEREQFYLDTLKPALNSITDIKRMFGEEMRAKIAASLRARAALITHCPKGHPYDVANTMIHQGKRVCRKCNAERVAGIYATETPEQRETRRIRATAQAQREKDREARQQYALAHKAEKKAYDAARAAEKAAKDRERRSDRTPEQIEAVNAGKRAYYAANRERVKIQLRDAYRRRQGRKLAPA